MDWTRAKATALDLLRNAYNREIERIAEELRPRIESGELRGFNDDDDDCMDAVRGGPKGTYDPEYESPMARLTAVLRERFSDSVDALLAMAVTSSEWQYGDCDEPAGDAASAAAVDVLRVAFRRGWYKPSAAKDEEPSAEALAREPVTVTP